MSSGVGELWEGKNFDLVVLGGRTREFCKFPSYFIFTVGLLNFSSLLCKKRSWKKN